MSLILLGLASAGALCASYLLGEAVGSRRVYEPVLPKATPSPEPERVKPVGPLMPLEEIDPATVPITLVSVEEIVATAEVAKKQTGLAGRYRAEARRLRRTK